MLPVVMNVIMPIMPIMPIMLVHFSTFHLEYDRVLHVIAR